MEITEVRVRLAERKQDRLRAFCSVTFDDAFVIRDVKVIQGDQGLFVAMPSRKLTDRCPSCSTKNQLRARHCSECGTKLAENRAELDDRGRPRLYVDIAHPVNTEARERIEQAVLVAYKEELERAGEPEYHPEPIDEEELGEPEDRPAPIDTGPEYRPEPIGEEELGEPKELERFVDFEEPPTRESEQKPPTPEAPPAPKPAERRHRFGEGVFEEEGPKGSSEQ